MCWWRGRGKEGGVRGGVRGSKVLWLLSIPVKCTTDILETSIHSFWLNEKHLPGTYVRGYS